jgi:hypothetical protein
VAKSSRKSRAPRSFRTLAEFATGLKTPLSTVSGWTKHPRWQWGRKAPWSGSIVPAVLRWAADNLERGRPAKSVTPSEEGDGSVADLRRQKLEQEIRKLRAHADQAETALAKERGDLHDADACEEEAVRRATLYRSAVQNIPTQVVSLALSHGMPHEAAPGFQKQIEELVNGCLRYTAASADAGSAAGDDAGA